MMPKARLCCVDEPHQRQLHQQALRPSALWSHAAGMPVSPSRAGVPLHEWLLWEASGIIFFWLCCPDEGFAAAVRMRAPASPLSSQRGRL